MAFAQQAGAAIENARLYEEARGRAALEERQRLARELHDSVSQALYGIVLNASTAQAVRQVDPPRLAGLLNDIVALAEAGLAEMRALIFELRPESLQEEGLVAALEKQAAAVQARRGITVRTALADEPDAPLAVKEALYRIAQEALHNVVKHASAAQVRVTLAREPGGVRLLIVDDGAGFDPADTPAGHLGLAGMRVRAEKIGARLDVTSALGRGTTIEVRAPVEPAVDADVAESLDAAPDQPAAEALARQMS
jgi:signal transduction histidine kinase